MLSGPLRTVESYLFRPNTFDRLATAPVVEVEALEWWDGSLVEEDGRKCIDIAEDWYGYGFWEPFAEVLSCGHAQAPRWSKKTKRTYYARRRRCRRCAIEALIGHGLPPIDLEAADR